jgi:hypothetical protein
MRGNFTWALVAASGCTGVDRVSSEGVLGRLTFSVGSNFYLEGEGFSDTAIVTGHPQTLSVSLTARGRSRYQNEADEIWYTVDTRTVEVDANPPDGDHGKDDTDADHPPSITLTASESAVARLTAWVNQDVVDYIDFTFQAPTELELVMFVRGPWSEPFLPVEPGPRPVGVEEGAQLAWLAIPRMDGTRLLGELVTPLGADPVTAVVPAANVENVNEDEAQSIFRADSLYFVAPGPVTVTLTDEVNDVTGEQAFTVAAPLKWAAAVLP